MKLLSTHKTLTVRQIQSFDKKAIHEIGIPSIALMENAGGAVAFETVQIIKKFPGNKRNVLIVCGVGNNAGDGFVCARHLAVRDVKVKIILIGEPRNLKADPAVHYRVVQNLGIPVIPWKSKDSLSKEIKRSSIVIDAILGVGLNRDIEDPLLSVIECINENAKFVISIDVPSGLDATTGVIYNVCVRADVTVTFSFLKKGFYKGQGPHLCGKIVTADIGIPQKLLNQSVHEKKSFKKF